MAPILHMQFRQFQKSRLIKSAHWTKPLSAFCIHDLAPCQEKFIPRWPVATLHAPDQQSFLKCHSGCSEDLSQWKPMQRNVQCIVLLLPFPIMGYCICNRVISDSDTEWEVTAPLSQCFHKSGWMRIVWRVLKNALRSDRKVLGGASGSTLSTTIFRLRWPVSELDEIKLIRYLNKRQ